MNKEKKIASFDDALNAFARSKGYADMQELMEMKDVFYPEFIFKEYREAAELYAEAKAREAWARGYDAACNDTGCNDIGIGEKLNETANNDTQKQEG